ncbi:MAG: response regulator transcription factor [Lachnospiraceae bacterium]|jgi:two-component system response regulator protein BraR/BceR|nr:response regulator transcription factor [Lachnospiraceae bacterium]
MYKIFVIEDDNVISGEIQSHLQKWGYEVKVTDDFSDIMSQFSKYAPQLVLMDIMLPFYNGYYWCNEIRKVSKVPIIFLSSAGDNMNIVMAMNMGGDDFITKPFDLEVLSAKVQAMLRRSYAFQNQTSLLEHKGVILNISDASLWYQDKKVELTKNEFKILQILFENVGNTVSREQIMKRLWDNECFVDDNTLTVNMTRMRKKLEEIGIINLIQTKKGMGYKIGE